MINQIYYTTKTKKFFDWLIGFLGILILCLIYFFLFAYEPYVDSKPILGRVIKTIEPWILMEKCYFFIVFMAFLSLFFKKFNRKFIAIGIISSLVIAVLMSIGAALMFRHVSFVG